MKQIFTYTFYAKKTFRFLLLLLVLLVALPSVDTQQVEAQTTKTGNFFTRRFKRKNKFKRKSKNSTAFQRKPFKCSEVGKPKVEQIKVSKKQLRRWEEERLVKAEQEKLKEQRQAKAQKNKTEENIVMSASSKNDLEEIANQKNERAEKDTRLEIENNDVKEDVSTERAGWYSSEKPEAPKVSPIIVNQKNEITSKKNKQELEIAAKHSRLGYTIVLESNNEKQLQTVKNYLISIGATAETIKVNTSENQNEVSLKIEK
ncbi:hypothetical protein ACE193_07580 [Bernardetia sp. OM2101]|uniref:hypothetical protein n=1 Tax=Bernardetia sp. OM2101 TaxID=3344876 RepID=UPI0035CF4A74